MAQQLNTMTILYKGIVPPCGEGYEEESPVQREMKVQIQEQRNYS